MKKLYLFTLLLSIFITSNIHAQLGIKGGFAAMGDLSSQFKYIQKGYAVGITYNITETIRGEALFEGVYSSPFEGVHLSTYPITIGADYRFFKGNIRPYAGLNMGVEIEKDKLEGLTYSYWHYTVHPKVGVNIGLTEHILIDFILKYHIIFDKISSISGVNNVFGINIGLIYVF
jgi:hypothetical protein